MWIKNPTDATVCRYLFTAKVLYMFRVSQHPSSGVSKFKVKKKKCVIVHHRFIPQEQLWNNISMQLFYSVYRKVFGEDGLRSGGLEIGFSIMTFSCSPCIFQEFMAIMELPGVHKSPGFQLYRQLNILWLCLEFVSHHCVHFFMSPIWHLEFWGGF